MKQIKKVDLPDPFLFENGVQVKTLEDFERRREEIYNLIIEIEYGGLPPAPSSTWYEELSTGNLKNLNDAHYNTLRIITDSQPRFSFLMDLLTPPGEGPFPVVLTGDACWNYMSNPIDLASEVLQRGYILARFNRLEMAPDIYNSDRVSGLYRIYPEGDYGALSAWAWGYHRCVDVLVEMDFVDASRIAVNGHSRGGKTSLLAGATDKRIAVTCANDSGSGGAGCYRWKGPESEELADTYKLAVGYWFGPRLKQFVGKETDMPFDQHFLKALVAPRALLTTEAYGDLWANPTGTWQTCLAAREVYRFYDAEKQIGIRYRQGDHYHSMEDWRVFLDFMDWQFQGCKSESALDTNPFPELQPAFSWSAPCNGTDGKQINAPNA